MSESTEETTPAAAPLPPPTIAKPNPVLDDFGNIVPDALLPVFSARPEFKKLMQAISDTKATIRKLAATVAGQNIDLQLADTGLDSARRALKFAVPCCLSPAGLQGVADWLTRDQHDNGLPPELKWPEKVA